MKGVVTVDVYPNNLRGKVEIGARHLVGDIRFFDTHWKEGRGHQQRGCACGGEGDMNELHRSQNRMPFILDNSIKKGR
jgi:hypothetical protein